jgi:tetratricopeptide (TPR) repeat protein
LKLDNFQGAMDDCKAALRIDEKFAKAYNRMSKCYIALGNLTEASFALQKSIELEPNNQVNKKDQKHLGDLKIIEKLINNAYDQGNYDKAVTNLT